MTLAAMLLGEMIEHRVTVSHGGAEHAATYRARVTLDTKTIGAHTPNRPSRQHCAWTAAITIERALDAAPQAARAVATDRTLRGTHPGACQTARPAIAETVARRSPAVRDRLVAAVEADRATLAAELAALNPNG
ncbi:hypothetical protein COC42_06270 [Sphingomonas spermidinifaciens]|uniref:Uncharacterized protein n=1 Tax=Sphingomonas spermidinifaciens TaxID=1141889 RepID=A0A2A4B780_9SPHN|nr:hypothetical protein COC42_06270 [Sphingomonas spermidinifaciens]